MENVAYAPHPEDQTPESRPASDPVEQALRIVRRRKKNGRRYHRRAFFKVAKEAAAAGALVVTLPAFGSVIGRFSDSRDPQYNIPTPAEIKPQKSIFAPITERILNFFTGPQQTSEQIHQDMVDKARLNGNPDLRRQREQLEKEETMQKADEDKRNI